MRSALCALIAASLVACDAKGESDVKGPKGSGETVADVAVTGDSVQAKDAKTDLVAPDAGCKDLRHPGDGKEDGDECWDPPLHYCSEGFGAASSVYCSSELALCCLFPAGCPSCGWEACTPGEPGCPSFDEVIDLEECKPYHDLPIGPESEICWDGVSPPR